jgi:predicted metal-binding protein
LEGGRRVKKKERKELEALFDKHGLADRAWIDPKDIVVAHWVRMKCMYGCRHYGHNAACPPNTPGVAECRRFFDEYHLAVVLHFEKAVDKPEDRHAWTKGVNEDLLSLEREVFIAGHPKTFLLFMDSCGLCGECAARREECHNPRQARPTPEGMAMDVFSTVRQYGFPIEVLSDYGQKMNRYAFLLIE